ncbi:hypothetical protein HanPI659440_Chr14g0525401 [Helianthus annuus]|nr:hypothetical protein HanPI659440_Chr14g0525401 [Helianthus annuus]
MSLNALNCSSFLTISLSLSIFKFSNPVFSLTICSNESFCCCNSFMASSKSLATKLLSLSKRSIRVSVSFFSSTNSLILFFISSSFFELAAYFFSKTASFSSNAPSSIRILSTNFLNSATEVCNSEFLPSSITFSSAITVFSSINFATSLRNSSTTPFASTKLVNIETRTTCTC